MQTVVMLIVKKRLHYRNLEMFFLLLVVQRLQGICLYAFHVILNT